MSWDEHRMQMRKYVGQWIVGPSVRFSLEKKPSWLHRTMTKLLLGWEWRDYNE